MSKIQILNETQVKHYFDVLYPELLAKFNPRKDELLKQAENEKDNFSTHEEVIKLRKEYDEKIEKSIKVIALQKELQKIDEAYYVSYNGWRTIATDDKKLENLKEEADKAIEDKKLQLSRKNLHVDDPWFRREVMNRELTARLSMTAVTDFDTIKDVILKSININSFFSTPIINE